MACTASEKVSLEDSGIVDRLRFELSRRSKAFKRRPVDRSRAEARRESPWVARNCASCRLSMARSTSAQGGPTGAELVRRVDGVAQRMQAAVDGGEDRP